MQETKLNAILVKSLKKDFSHGLFSNLGIEVAKRHGSIFSKNYPDIEGCFCGQSYYIEGKIGKIPKTNIGSVVSSKQYTDGQRNKMEELYLSNALVLTGIYIHENGNKYCLLIPYASEIFNHIMTDTFSKDVLMCHAQEYLCEYRNQSYNTKKVFSSLMKTHTKRVFDLICNFVSDKTVFLEEEETKTRYFKEFFRKKKR